MAKYVLGQTWRNSIERALNSCARNKLKKVMASCQRARKFHGLRTNYVPILKKKKNKKKKKKR